MTHVVAIVALAAACGLWVVLTRATRRARGLVADDPVDPEACQGCQCGKAAAGEGCRRKAD